MSEPAIEIKADGSASIFRNGKPYRRELSKGGSGFQWVKRTSRGIRPVSKSRARQLERIYRHPERATAFRRFPRLPAEDIAAEANASHIVELETRAFDWIARGHEANIELGRVFNQIKALLKHGEWKSYFAEKFAPRGIPLRTATAYMGLAREADEITKKADSALFPPAIDPQAQEINAATEEAKAAIATAVEQSADKEIKKPRKERVRLDGVYRLPLYMTGDEKDATDQLLESEDWQSAEMELLGLLRSLHVKHGIVNDSEESGSADSTDASEEGSSNEDDPN